MTKRAVRKGEWAEIAPALFKGLEHVDLFRSCLTCIGFNEQTEQCKRYKQRPPARIIANGCETYDDTSDIPF